MNTLIKQTSNWQERRYTRLVLASFLCSRNSPTITAILRLLKDRDLRFYDDGNTPIFQFLDYTLCYHKPQHENETTLVGYFSFSDEENGENCKITKVSKTNLRQIGVFYPISEL